MFRTAALTFLALTLVVPAASAQIVEDGALQFGLTDNAGAFSNSLEMTAESADGDGGTVSLIPSQRWVASDPAEVSFDVDGQNVLISLDVSEFVGVQELQVFVGKVDPSGTFTEAGNTTAESFLNTDPVITITVPVDPQSFDVGDRPALEISANTAGIGSIAQISTTDQSFADYEGSSAPEAYPTPELGTLLLSGIGLLGMVGMSRIRNRR